ncbi:WD40/YVTN repeat-like-containing domain,WD40 repeat, conserved site,WD40 repeat,WD40-repeat-containing [Cinara cedri]|uniref:WD40/YVTN repeat-like-containing domain,WD40 repeat, conserved site,WD40 repeat,WD40-repeat-containing n=1 Tax=Cinara cedri TaxID=506608 RepID=A0A5E4MZR0_9HEMI|nr:WD40/YVTN repeat-like-containing domain,WD40 repeat, conserved site,WD40 repeat,WD40-repeat-containing [Cinara cedri]
MIFTDNKNIELLKDGSVSSSLSHTSSPRSQNGQKMKSNVPVPRPRSTTSKRSGSTSDYSIRSISVSSPISTKSSIQNSRSVTPESVSIELSDSEITDSSTRIKLLKKKLEENNDTNNMELSTVNNEVDPNILNKEAKDVLKVDTRIRHPSVIIYIINTSTWEYLRKNNADLTNNENAFIDPIITKEFDFKLHKTIIPNWNEKLVFNEQFTHIITENTVILFELVDFTGSIRPSVTVGDWHRIAWAFIKPIGSNGNTNTEKQIRLQLFKPGPKPKNLHSTQPMVMHWFKKGILKKYPSTLYINLNRAIYSELDAVCDCNRQELMSTKSYSHNEISSNSVCSSPEAYKEYNIKWKRFPGQKCKIPNSEVVKLQPNLEGCMCLKFSYDGLKLAVATGKNINIYSVPEYKLLKQLIGHQGLVYTLRWSSDNNNLLTTSSDYTACVWMLKTYNQTDFQILPHPSYVYCAEYNNAVIITGCYDSILRLWTSNFNKWTLCQEMELHKGFISSIANLENVVLSADSHGLIIEWTLINNRLEVKRIISVPEIRQVIISNIILHPAGKRLLIQTRDSVLRMMDLHTTAIIQWFRGGVNNKVQTGCVLSPCGNLVFGCGEDGLVNVWEAYTAKQIAFYINRQNLITATSGGVDYHPHDHIIVFGVYTLNKNSPVYVAQYKKENEKDIGLRFLIPIEHKQKVFRKINYQTTAYGYLDKTKAKENENQRMMPLVNIIKKMDSVLNSFKTN